MPFRQQCTRARIVCAHCVRACSCAVGLHSASHTRSLRFARSDAGACVGPYGQRIVLVNHEPSPCRLQRVAGAHLPFLLILTVQQARFHTHHGQCFAAHARIGYRPLLSFVVSTLRCGSAAELGDAGMGPAWHPLPPRPPHTVPDGFDAPQPMVPRARFRFLALEWGVGLLEGRRWGNAVFLLHSPFLRSTLLETENMSIHIWQDMNRRIFTAW